MDTQSSPLPTTHQQQQRAKRHSSAIATASGRPLSTISAQHYDHLIGELRCPGCTKPLGAPIRLCAGGHSLCGGCTRSPAIAGQCPLCAQSLTAGRSLALEQLAARAAFACSNAPHGCTARLQTPALREHEHSCVYQMGDCFMGRVWGGCAWTGRELDWLDHCQAAHAERIFDRPEQRLRWQCTSYERQPKALAAYYMFRVFGERIG